MAVITCDPAVVDENAYVAEPSDSGREGFAVAPSTAMLKVPVGMAVSELAAGDTVIVTISSAPDAGDAVAADSVVVDPANIEDEVVGQAESR